jgi:type III secretory pathway lipoprotein EscJ
MMVAWRIADESNMFNKDSVIDSEIKEKFKYVRELDDDIHRSKLKGKFFY